MNALRLVGWILTHVARGRRKHANVENPGDGVSRIAARFELAKRAAGAGGGPEDRPLLARRLMQLAGLCLRIVDDLKLEHPTIVAQDGPNPNALPVPLAWRPIGSEKPFSQLVPPRTRPLRGTAAPDDKGDKFPPPTPTPIPPVDEPIDIPDWPSDPTIATATSPVPGGVTDPASVAGAN